MRRNLRAIRSVIAAACLACFLAGSAPAAFAQSIPPDVGGVLVVATSTAFAEDLRLGRLAARFAHRGLESFVAADCVRPPPDPERGLVHARWRLDDARRARRLRRFPAAAAASDEAIRVIEQHAFERGHLDLLVEALIERGATAMEVGDPATAETVFLKALAIDPLREVDADLYGAQVQQVFGDVRRASRELRYGSIRVEVVNLPGAVVAIDFGSPQDAPVQVNLPDGRHFISVSAPTRHEVVAFVPVRAERETLVHLRPPLSGDVRERAAVLATFRARDERAVYDLARAVGMRFVLTVRIADTMQLALLDGYTGKPIGGADATLSLDPNSDEIDAAVTRIVAAAMKIEPRLNPETEAPGWYSTWWGIGLIGAAAIGAGTAAVLILTSGGNTDYRFDPP